MLEKTVVIVVMIAVVLAAAAPATAAPCGGNDRTIDVVSPGYGADERAAVIDAEAALAKDRPAAEKILDAWASGLVCPMSCKHKYDLGTKAGTADLVIVNDEATGLGAFSRWNAARAKVEVQEGQTLTRTVCFPLEAEQLMASRATPREVSAITADPSGRRWRMKMDADGRVLRAEALDAWRTGRPRYTWQAERQSFVESPTRR